MFSVVRSPGNKRVTPEARVEADAENADIRKITRHLVADKVAAASPLSVYDGTTGRRLALPIAARRRRSLRDGHRRRRLCTCRRQRRASSSTASMGSSGRGRWPPVGRGAHPHARAVLAFAQAVVRLLCVALFRRRPPVGTGGRRLPRRVLDRLVAGPAAGPRPRRRLPVYPRRLGAPAPSPAAAPTAAWIVGSRDAGPPRAARGPLGGVRRRDDVSGCERVSRVVRRRRRAVHARARWTRRRCRAASRGAGRRTRRRRAACDGLHGGAHICLVQHRLQCARQQEVHIPCAVRRPRRRFARGATCFPHPCPRTSAGASRRAA